MDHLNGLRNTKFVYFINLISHMEEHSISGNGILGGSERANRCLG